MVSSFKQVKQRSKWVMGPHGEVVRMDIPRNFKEMELDADAPLYYAACEREMASQRDCKSWTLVDIDSDAVQGRNIISCRWVYDLKTVVDAGVESLRGVDPHKARLVARGFEEVPGEDWFEKYFGVTRLVTVRTIMAMAAEHGWRLWAMDVETAYLQAELRDVVVYMYQPEGFVEPPPPGVRMLVCKLDKALYGLVQSAREWGITFSEWMRTWRYLEQHAFVRGGADAQCYVMSAMGETLVVLVHVDDLIMASSHESIRLAFVAGVSARFKMKDLGPLSRAVGCEVSQDMEAGRVVLTLSAYLANAARRFELLADTHAYDVPAPTEMVRRCVKAEVDAREVAEVADQYASMTGVILFVASFVRPDAVWAAHFLSRYTHKPGHVHLALARRVLGYLVRTRHMGLRYQRTGSTEIRAGYVPMVPDETVDGGLHGCSDADFAVGPSTTAYAFMLAGAAIDWLCRLQVSSSLSSAESEFYSLSAAVAEVVFLRNLLQELGVRFSGPTTVYCDSRGARLLASDMAATIRTRHILRRWYFCNYYIEQGHVKVATTAGNRNPANTISKCVVGSAFKFERKYLLNLTR